MSENNTAHPVDTVLVGAIRAQIEEVVNLCERLKRENANLRKQASELMEQKRRLIKAEDCARERLQVVIGRMRELENMRPKSKSG